MNEQALIEELKKPEYAGLTDQQAADAVNAKTVTIRQPVDAAILRKTLAIRGRWGGLQRVANNFESPDPPYQQARTLIDMITAGDGINADEPAVADGAPILVQHGLLDASDLQAMSALANKTLRWVDVEGIGEVGIGYVINARRAIAGGA